MKNNGLFSVFISRSDHYEESKVFPAPSPHPAHTEHLTFAFIPDCAKRLLHCLAALLGDIKSSRWISRSPYSESGCVQSWKLAWGPCYGLAVPTFWLCSLAYISCPFVDPKLKRKQRGTGRNGVGLGRRHQRDLVQPSSSALPTEESADLVKVFSSSGQPPQDFLPPFSCSSSFLDHNQISLQCILSWITSAGRVNTSEHAHEQRYYRRQSLLMPA